MLLAQVCGQVLDLSKVSADLQGAQSLSILWNCSQVHHLSCIVFNFAGRIGYKSSEVSECQALC